jgi:hypothetical protein
MKIMNRWIVVLVTDFVWQGMSHDMGQREHHQ